MTVYTGLIVTAKMPHPIGVITCNPRADFSILRSYIRRVRWAIHPALSIFGSGNEWEFTYAPIPTYRAYAKLRDEFWEWSSNNYSLDYVMEWFYDKNSPSDPEVGVNFSAIWHYDTVLAEPILQFNTVSPTIESDYNLPPRSQPYWMPDRPPLPPP